MDDLNPEQKQMFNELQEEKKDLINKIAGLQFYLEIQDFKLQIIHLREEIRVLKSIVDSLQSQLRKEVEDAENQPGTSGI